MRSALKLFLAAGLLFALPMTGVLMAGYPVSRCFEFPPETRYVRAAPFSWPVFWGYALFILATAGALVLRAVRSIKSAREHLQKAHFPWWGWLATGAGLLFWLLAWSRFAWFQPLQAHTFLPLWLCFIVAVNALTVRRKGASLLTENRSFFLLLFPASAAFWWFFEYLNRFVQNWHYGGVHYSAGRYFLHATLSFATVLPAVMSVREWLLTLGWIRHGFENFIAVSFLNSRKAAGLILLVAAVGLAATGVWPDYLFSLLWTAPLLVLVSLQVLWGKSHMLTRLAFGDWRPIISSAFAALLCGWFWEMWNFFSLAKWEYSIPYVDRFRIFEMPLLGYAGYLPFGLECAVIAELVAVGAVRCGILKPYRLPPDLCSGRGMPLA